MSDPSGSANISSN